MHGIFDIYFGCLHVFFLNSKVSSGLKTVEWKNNDFAFIPYYHLLLCSVRDAEIKSKSLESARDAFNLTIVSY